MKHISTPTPDQLLRDRLADEPSTQAKNDPNLKVSVNEKNQIVITKRQSYFQDVVDFHKKYGIQYDGPPRILPMDLLTFRGQRLSEEFREYANAITQNQMADALDGLVDLIYIALGTAHLHGWNFEEAWRRVHEANMKKELASKENPGKYKSNVDIVKPVGWIAPDLQDLVITP